MQTLSGSVRVVVVLIILVALAITAWWAFSKRSVVDVPTPTGEESVRPTTGVALGGGMTDPQKTVYDNLKQSKDHTTLLTAFQTAGLAAMLQSSQQVTVFVPSNAAFGKLSRETVQGLLKPENAPILKSVLNYHVVPGQYATKDLRDGMKLKTVQGQELVFTQKDGKWWINGKAALEVADIYSVNGVAHGVDMVLSTPTQ